MTGPKLICEAWTSACITRGGEHRDARLHIRPTEKSGRTLCELDVANGTMIPLAAWNATDEPDAQKRCTKCAKRYAANCADNAERYQALSLQTCEHLAETGFDPTAIAETLATAAT